MLCVSKYPKAYVNTCERHIGRQLEAYRALGPVGRTGACTFETQFFNHLLLALDHYFCHRSRGREGKDGSALNELRMLCTSVMEGTNRLLGDSTVRYDAGKSVLQLSIGDKIDLDADMFESLATAVFADVRAKLM